jgi:hypothetical protein
MKLPEPFFRVINPMMRMLLRSPLHFFLSKSLMLITFTGRASNKQFTTPVRYLRTANSIRCFTSAENQWWRNLRGGADVILRIQGKDAQYHAIAIFADPARVRQGLEDYLKVFPQDAAYHDIGLTRDKGLVKEDLDRASTMAVIVEAQPA